MEIFDRTVKLALYRLESRARTSKQVADYLREKDIDDDTIEEVIARLVQYGYIDDDAYAARYAATRIKRGGARKIAFELKQKGVDSQTVTNAIESIDQDEQLRFATAHAYKALSGQSDAKARQRAYAALARRGYTGDVIRRAMENAIDQVRKDIEGEDTE